jgi:hypothetical protein
MLAPKKINTLKGGKPCLWFCSDQTGARAAEELLKMENRNTEIRHISREKLEKCKNFQCCGSGMFIPDPKFF